MSDRRLVGIDLGIASAHTVWVLDGEGNTVAKRRAWRGQPRRGGGGGAGRLPTGTRLEVVMEPTGPAWLPITVFFAARGHVVHRVSSAKAADLRRSAPVPAPAHQDQRHRRRHAGPPAAVCELSRC